MDKGEEPTSTERVVSSTGARDGECRVNDGCWVCPFHRLKPVTVPESAKRRVRRGSNTVEMGFATPDVSDLLSDNADDIRSTRPMVIRRYFRHASSLAHRPCKRMSASCSPSDAILVALPDRKL
jgi:hypothetical protein